MIKSIIKELFLGQRGTYERVKLSEDYKEVETKMYTIVDEFLEKLSKEQQELFHSGYRNS